VAGVYAYARYKREPFAQHINVAFAPLGIPALTAPFVLASWLFLLPQQHFAAADDAKP